MFKFFQKSPESKNFEKLKEIIEKAECVGVERWENKGAYAKIYRVEKFNFVKLGYLYTNYYVDKFDPANGQLKDVNLTKKQAKTLFEMAEKKNLINL